VGPLDFHVFLQPVPTGETTYLGWLLQGLRTTVLLSACAWAVALVLGSLLGVFRTVPSRALRAIAGAYVEVFRNVPLLVQLFIWYFVVPEIVPGGERFKQIDPWLQAYAEGFDLMHESTYKIDVGAVAALWMHGSVVRSWLLELTAQGRQLVDYTARAYESFLAVTVLYLLLNAAVLLIMRKVEARTRVPGYLGSGR